MKLYEMVRRLRAKAREDCPPKFPHERMPDWIAADALEAQAREIERLEARVAELEYWNGAVAVCADHVQDIVSATPGLCVICDMEKLEAAAIPRDGETT